MEFDGTRWVGPDGGATWLNLIATVTGIYRNEPVDHLTTPALLRSWLGEENLPLRKNPTDYDLGRTRALRSALRAMTTALVLGEEWSTADVGMVNAILAEDRPLIVDRGRIKPPATVEEALARIAREAVTDLTGPAAAHLHKCADGTCGMFFLDPSGRRRWCSAEVCGVRNRVRAHRQRTGG
jgi:predicted RNA-binding Zn ribbon-like protein